MKKGKNKHTLRRVLKLLHPYRFFIAVSMILAVVIVAATLYLPILSGKAVDLLLTKDSVDFEKLFAILKIMAVMIFITAAGQYCMTRATNHIAYHVVKDMRTMAFERLLKLPLRYVDEHSHGDIISRIITDVDQFSEGLLMGFAQFITGALTIILTLYFMFRLNPWITLIVICVTPVSIFVAAFIAGKSYRHFHNQSVKRGAMTAVAEEMLEGLSCVRAFNMEDKVCESFKKADEELRKAGLKAIFYSSITNPSTRFVNSLVYAGVGIFGALSVIGGGISVGGLTAFLSYATQYTKPFNEISGVVTELQNSLACAGRIFDLIDTPEETKDKNDAYILERANGEVNLENVSFSYSSDKPLIENLNLKVQPGKRIAIVGPTGCGKTTLINLLMRFYDVDQGKITVDEHDIRNITRKSLRASYGMVLQDTWLKNGTIRDNIAMGREDASEDEIIKAAKEAYALGFIERLPQGFDTVVSQDGTNLSAGQRQLLCIARVMLKLPPILILDEATSSIDTRTELCIQNAFSKMMQGRTSFIVAHRLSTIRDADIILVMRDGHIIEQGKHEQLLLKGGFYANLYNSQFKTA